METGLKGQKVLILGSSRGIGFGIAERFLYEKANVIITGRNDKDLRRALVYLRGLRKGQVTSYQGDMLQHAEIENLRNMVKEKFGSLDHLICNIGSGRSVPPGEEDIAEIRRMFDINFFYAAESIKAFRPLLRRKSNSANDYATITLIGSICGRQVLGCPAAYAAAKAALVHYAQNLTGPLAREGIRINIVSPGNILFPGSVWEQKLKVAKSDVTRMLKRDVPLKKFGTPHDVGATVVYAASRSAGFLTGAELVVDGGQSL